MSEDLSHAVDALREDMALHQRAHAPEVTDSRNHTLAANALARLEIEQRDAKPAPVVEPEIVEIPATMRREINGHEYVVGKSPADQTKVRKANAAEHRFLTHALPRIELLMTKLDTGPLGEPSWHQRTLAVMELKRRVPDLLRAGYYQAAAETDARFLFEMMELLKDSNRLFGDWEADPGTRVSVTV